MNATYDTISRKIGVSSGLIGMVENGDVTHPIIVEKLKAFFKLTDEEAEELLPKNRRTHDPEYDPDKYVAEVDKHPPVIVSQKQTLVERYMTEHHNDQVKNHARRSYYR